LVWTFPEVYWSLLNVFDLIEQRHSPLSAEFFVNHIDVRKVFVIRCALKSATVLGRRNSGMVCGTVLVFSGMGRVCGESVFTGLIWAQVFLSYPLALRLLLRRSWNFFSRLGCVIIVILFQE